MIRATLQAKGKLDKFEQYKKEAERSGKQTSVWLREKCEIYFNSAAGIRSAYESTFGDGMTSLFSRKSFRRMIVVQSFRNVIVHNAAAIDSAFVKTAEENRDLFGEFVTLKVGQPIPLDGEIVRRFAGTTSFCSDALLTRVKRSC